jgi:1,4-dihydroxy-2-naphthoate octaprenyltransferase
MLQTRSGYRTAPDLDMRRGIVLIALGAACFLAALFVKSHAASGLAILGAFPLMVGIGFVVSSKLLRDKTLEGSD